MQIGISLASGSRLPPAAAGAHLVARARAAASAGLDSLTLGDSHAAGRRTHLQNVPALARVLAEWSGRPAGCLFLLPLWSPVLVAEQVATLAALHDGPFVVQTGLGGSPHELAAMERRGDRRVSAFVESVRVIDALLAGESVSSEVFGFTDVAVGATPVADLDWWMGTMVPAGLRRAARFDAAWYASPGVTADRFRSLDAVYRAACAEFATRHRVMLRLDALVLGDGDRAHRMAAAAVDRGYRGLGVGHLLTGSVDEVVTQVAGWAESGVDQVVVRTMGIDPESDLETIGCMGAVRAAFAN